MTEQTYTGHLDEFGLFHESEDGDIEVRYDESDNP